MIDDITAEQVINLLAERLDESESEQAERLAEKAGEEGINPETLLEAEENIRILYSEKLPPEVVNSVVPYIQQFAPMYGVDPELVNDLNHQTTARLLAQTATADPERFAVIAMYLFAALRDAGLFEEYGIDRPPAGTFRETMPVNGGGDA